MWRAAGVIIFALVYVCIEGRWETREWQGFPRMLILRLHEINWEDIAIRREREKVTPLSRCTDSIIYDQYRISCNLLVGCRADGGRYLARVMLRWQFSINTTAS